MNAIRTSRVRTVVAVGCVLALAGPAWAGAADKAAAFAAEGDGLLGKADFEGALKAYAQAAKADSQNPDYRQQYAVLRRIIKMRQSVDKETNPEKWAGIVRGLRAFYYDRDIYPEALALDQKVHAKTGTPESASALAQSQLQMGLNAEAAATLSSIDETAATPESRVLLGIALARQGDIDQAKAVAAKIEIPKGTPPILFYNTACLHALIGDSDSAMTLLTRCFENTPPSRLDNIKERAKTDEDLTTLVASADFADVLETKSKVKESSCSGGTSCGGCPSRSKCASAKSKTDKAHK